jgi:hypothetical protein
MTDLEILYFIAYHLLSFGFVVVWFSPEQPFTSGLFCSVEAINDCESITGSFKIKVLFALQHRAGTGSSRYFLHVFKTLRNSFDASQ